MGRGESFLSLMDISKPGGFSEQSGSYVFTVYLVGSYLYVHYFLL